MASTFRRFSPHLRRRNTQPAQSLRLDRGTESLMLNTKRCLFPNVSFCRLGGIYSSVTLCSGMRYPPLAPLQTTHQGTL